MSERIDGRKLRFEHRRDEVLQAAMEHALEHGIANLSLREVAHSAGVSHATLVHHFEAKDKLVGEIVDQVLATTLSVPDLPAEDPDPLRTIWRRATSTPGDRYVKLFVAITGQAMHGNPTLADALARSIEHRIDLLAEGLVRHGCSRTKARSLATATLGTMRGLVIDYYITGDEPRVHAAFEAMLTSLQTQLGQHRT